MKAITASERSRDDEEVRIVGINKAKEIPVLDEAWKINDQEVSIKEYFFGDSKLVLSPSTQLVSYDSLVIYKLQDCKYLPMLRLLLYCCSVVGSWKLMEETKAKFTIESGLLERTEPEIDMLHFTLAIMQASTKDPPEVVRRAPVLGFVYIAQVSDDINKVKLLGPLPARFGEHPMIWGKWPVEHVNLL